MTLLLCPLQMTFVPIHEFYLLYKGCVRGLFLAIYLNSKWQVQLPLTKFIYYLVGSTLTYLYCLCMIQTNFSPLVYIIFWKERAVASIPPSKIEKKTSICNHSDICTFKHYIFRNESCMYTYILLNCYQKYIVL